MAAVEDQAVTTGSAKDESRLQELAKRHLWMHFTRMGALRRRPRDPDHRPRRGLLRLGRARQALPRRALRAVLREHRPRPRRRRPGRRRPGARSSASSPTGPTRTRRRSSSPRGSPTLAPGDLNRVFFTCGGSRGGRLRAQALPPVPQAHRQPRALQGHRAQARLPRHDDGRAHRDRHPGRARAVRAAVPRLGARAEHEHLPAPRSTTRPRRSRERIEFEGPETVSCVILEPVQNAGGCFAPPEGYFQRVREICDEYDVLLHLRRGHLLVGPPRRRTSAPSATTTSPTSSPRPRASPRPTRRWAR